MEARASDRPGSCARGLSSSEHIEGCAVAASPTRSGHNAHFKPPSGIKSRAEGARLRLGLSCPD